MKLFEIRHTVKDMLATLPPDTSSKLKGWYDGGITYGEMGKRLSQIAGYNYLFFGPERIVKILDNIYPERPLRTEGGWKGRDSVIGTPSKYRIPPEKTDPRGPKIENPGNDK